MSYSFFKYEHTFIFTLLVVLLAIYYRYPARITTMPQSDVEANGATLAKLYAQDESISIFESAYYNQERSSFSSLFSTVHYGVSRIYHSLGIHPIIFRGLSFLLLFIGLLALSKVILALLQDDLLSFAIPLFLLSSPLVAYHAIGFTGEIPALGLVGIGWFLFYKYAQSKRISWLVLSLLSFAIASIVHPLAFISFVPLVLIWFIETLGIYKFQNTKRLFEQRWWTIAPFILSFLGIVFFYNWRAGHNEINLLGLQQTPFFTTLNLSIDGIINGFGEIMEVFGHRYLPLISHAIVILLAIFIIITPRRQNAFLYLLLLFTLLVGGLLGFYFFEFLKVDTPLVIPFLVVSIVSLISIGFFIKKQYPHFLNSYFFKMIILALVCYNAYEAKSFITKKSKTYPELAIFQDKDLPPFLDSLGIQDNDMLISLPDSSSHFSLYYLNHKGITLYHKEVSDYVTTIANFRNTNKYLIVNNKALLEEESLTPYLTESLGIFKDKLYIYRLAIE